MTDPLPFSKTGRRPEYPETVKRGKLGEAQKEALKARQDHRCAGCGIKPKRWEWDHILEVWEGGRSDALDNWQGFGAREECACHKTKTAAAAKRRAKMNRLRGLTGQLKRLREKGPVLKGRSFLPGKGAVKLRSRGFDKTKTRGLNGKVRERIQ